VKYCTICYQLLEINQEFTAAFWNVSTGLNNNNIRSVAQRQGFISSFNLENVAAGLLGSKKIVDHLRGRKGEFVFGS